MKIDGKRLAKLLTDLGWDYQCLTTSGKETYDEMIQMIGVIEENEVYMEI